MCITDNNEDEKEGIYSATSMAMPVCVKTEGQTSPPGVSLTAWGLCVCVCKSVWRDETA